MLVEYCLGVDIRVRRYTNKRGIEQNSHPREQINFGCWHFIVCVKNVDYYYNLLSTFVTIIHIYISLLSPPRNFEGMGMGMGILGEWQTRDDSLTIRECHSLNVKGNDNRWFPWGVGGWLKKSEKKRPGPDGRDASRCTEVDVIGVQRC